MLVNWAGKKFFFFFVESSRVSICRLNQVQISKKGKIIGHLPNIFLKVNCKEKFRILISIYFTDTSDSQTDISLLMHLQSLTCVHILLASIHVSYAGRNHHHACPCINQHFAALLQLNFS